MNIKIQQNVSLKKFNTFGIDSIADYFVTVRNENDIQRLIESDIFQNNKSLVLGGGSNILFIGDFHGLIIDVGIVGISIKDLTDDSLIMEVGSGIIWDDFVRLCVKSKYHGVENLALIPGKVGAAPVQNIGAYGIEQMDCLQSVKGITLSSGERFELSKEECEFAYRSSIFKHELKDKVIITSVCYKLSRKEQFNLTYKELAQEVNKFPSVKPDIQYIYDTVCRIRKRKLPNPAEIGNAGSFFNNPIVSEETFKNLKNDFSEISGFSVSGNTIKLSAGWLIEQCGWKGKKIGDAGVYDKHALILVNYGKASGNDILNVSDAIQESVKDKFGITLEKEVTVINLD